MTSIAQKMTNTENSGKHAVFHMLIKRILVGSLVILFIGVCSFSVLFTAMYLL